MGRLMSSAERWQVPLYLAALAVGAVAGYLLPDAAGFFEASIAPVLVALLYATFLAVPFGSAKDAFGDTRFIAAVMVVNFVAVPVVVFVLSRWLLFDRALLVGALLVLLAPCIDYVIVFTRLAGGDWARLLAAAPVLMLVQLFALPVLLPWFAGAETVADIEVGPFLNALILFILAPLGLSWLSQAAGKRYRPARRLMRAMEALMVPLMVATLAVVTASQVTRVLPRIASLLWAIPVYVVFLLVMPVIGALVARAARQDAPARRAIAMSGSTRNSLVVLPLALALPEELAVAASAVVTQTLVELFGMVVFVRLLPQLIKDAPQAAD